MVVDDQFIEPLLPEFERLNLFWHTLDVPGSGLAYCGITLIPPESLVRFASLVGNNAALADFRQLLLEAKERHQFVIHFGL